jgi:hypothetical protein
MVLTVTFHIFPSATATYIFLPFSFPNTEYYFAHPYSSREQCLAMQALPGINIQTALSGGISLKNGLFRCVRQRFKSLWRKPSHASSMRRSRRVSGRMLDTGTPLCPLVSLNSLHDSL